MHYIDYTLEMADVQEGQATAWRVQRRAKDD